MRKIIFFILFSFLVPFIAFSYIGPGAGFAILGSFMVFFFALLSALLAILVFPARFMVRLVKVKRLGNKPFVRRAIIIGFDGLDPELCQKWMDEEKLPNFKKLSTKGAFKRLGTSMPSMSPVAWSSFATGTNPAKHNIFDFLSVDKNNYLPVLSSAKVRQSARVLRIGSYRVPLKKPEVQLLRKSKSFWKILGEHWIFSHIIRVPITFPAEEFYGVMLSGMCVPDLRGTQGSFIYYRADGAPEKRTGGVEIKLEKVGRGYKSYIPGPENSFRADKEELRIDFELVKEDGKDWLLILDRKKIKLEPERYSDWVKLKFRSLAGINVYGIARFMLLKTEPPELYLSPINLDPENPAMRISHPGFYSIYLSKILGPFATLGLAEDSWALNEKVISSEQFLAQCFDYYRERERMLFHCLERTRKGLLAMVFDHTDRIQHTFFRCFDQKHPLYETEDAKRFRSVIEELYVHCDELLGKVLEKIGPRDLLLIISDHGFKSFRRGVNLNSWLWKEGYLYCKSPEGSSELFKEVDWSRTRAYSLGLSGIYLNIKGREANGIIERGKEEEELTFELVDKLTGLKDKERNEVAILRAYASKEHLSGPYIDNAPDIIVGYNDGYRASWDGTMGVVNNVIFEDNKKSWSGDHCVDPSLVPGVIFSNKPIDKENPEIIDIAPSILRAFDIKIPAYMDGKALWNDQTLNSWKGK